MSFVVQLSNGWVIAKGAPFFDAAWTSDPADAVTFQTADEAIGASALAGGTVRKWEDVFAQEASPAVFCVNCGEFLGTDPAVSVVLLEALDGHQAGDTVSACTRCAQALREDGVAK